MLEQGCEVNCKGVKERWRLTFSDQLPFSHLIKENRAKPGRQERLQRAEDEVNAAGKVGVTRRKI